jgi:hypothetical protein
LEKVRWPCSPCSYFHWDHEACTSSSGLAESFWLRQCKDSDWLLWKTCDWSYWKLRHVCTLQAPHALLLGVYPRCSLFWCCNIRPNKMLFPNDIFFPSCDLYHG